MEDACLCQTNSTPLGDLTLVKQRLVSYCSLGVYKSNILQRTSPRTGMNICCISWLTSPSCGVSTVPEAETVTMGTAGSSAEDTKSHFVMNSSYQSSIWGHL